MTKNIVKRVLNRLLGMLIHIPGGQYVYGQILNIAMERRETVIYRAVCMTFASPNWLNQYRISTFSSKEPETLEWIESIPGGSVVWDVGANIGLYSIYAAKAQSCRVYAFEPSVFNLELLARNIYLNDLQNKITIVPIALTDKRGPSLFKMSTTTWGGALSTFGQDFDQNGETLKVQFEYTTYGVSMAEAAALLGIMSPQHLKIDVDGIEHFILRGGKEILAKVDSVLIEINDDFREQADECSRHLQESGLTLYRKCNLGLPNQYNQWWRREAGLTSSIRASQ